MKRLLPTLLIAAPLLFCACDSEAPVAKIIVTDQKMALTEWPDSAYIASLDSILALEPIKKGAEAEANISVNTFEAPTFKLPGSVTGKKDPKPNHMSKSAVTRQSNGPAKSDNAGAKAEAFADRFAGALGKLQSDPSNSSLYKVVEAKDGDDLFKLLKRTYGAGVQNLPRFYVLSTLQSVNAGVMLEHLNAGDKVRVPRI